MRRLTGGLFRYGSALSQEARITGPQRFTLLDEVRRGLPDGFKAELPGDTIVMLLSPSGIPSTSETCWSCAASSTLTYLPEGVLETTDNQVPAETAAIAVELLSPSNPENVWVGKVRDYPLMGIPLYLLIGARLKTVTLFSPPAGSAYHRREDIGFGETLHIPAPFDFELATSALIAYT